MQIEKSTADRLRSIQNRQLRILAGFDGFVDTIVRPVKSTQEDGNHYFATIGELGQFLVGKAGKS